MPHLFDENALEQQEPLRHTASSQSGESDNSENDIDYDAIEVGDFVTIRAQSTSDVPIYAVVMPPEDIFIPSEMHPATLGSADEWVPVWLVAPTHCGDPQHLFQYVREDDLQIVDRPVDLNTIVVDRESLEFGVVRSQRVTCTALLLEKLLTYHRERRHNAVSEQLSKGLGQPPKKNVPIRRQPWYQALQEHQKIIRSDPELQQMTFDGCNFVRANPFFVGQHVRSVNRCIPVEDDAVSSERNHGDINVNDVNNEGETKYNHFSGHVRAVSYSVLVELMLPPIPSGSSSLGEIDEPFLVMMPPEMIETTIQDDVGHRQILFRNVRNMFRMEASMHGEYVETSDDASVAPSQMDIVAPMMYAEMITMEALETKVLWVRGTFEGYCQELDSRLSHHSHSGAAKKTKKSARGDQKAQKSAGDAGNPNERYANGIVVFGFPEVITAVDFRTNLPRDFNAYEIVAVETSGTDNAFAGQHGFALPPDDPLFDRALNASDPSEDDVLASVGVVAPTDDMARWYREHGILTTSLEEQHDWFTRLQKLHKVLGKLVWITSSLSHLSVIWKESGEISFIDSEKVASGERSYSAVRDVFPMDIVVPQAMYAVSRKFDELAAAATEANAGVIATPMSLLADPACPIHDLKMVFDYGTDFQPGESVVPRRGQERFVVEGEELTSDPKILGRVVSANSEDETCSVVWYFQPDLTELALRRPHDVGQIVELLPNTNVRVLWSDGAVEDIARVMLEPVRAAGADERDEEEEEEEEEDGEQNDDDTHVQPLAEPEGINQPDAEVPNTAAVEPIAESWFQRLKRGVTELVVATTSQSKVTLASAQGGAEEEEPLPTSPVDDENLFPSFAANAQTPACEVVSMFSKHIFQREDGTEPRQHAPIFLKRTLREWKDMVAHIDQSPQAHGDGTLTTTPSSMFVKCCSSSPELVKFVIIGALHTPYYQSFLAFDLYYPPTFPIEPPSVRFHSYNLRLNPNLYADGYICLSLLGTWDSNDSTETWLPATSSVMQILLSLQSLVLIKEPYYNEAGYDEYRGTPMGRTHSKTYNENLALLRIQHLILMAESPPPDWVFAFRQYFLSTAPRIADRLSRLADEQEAAKLASKESVDGGEGITADGLVLPLSKGFIHSLRRHVGLLKECIATFKEKWAAEEEAVLQDLDHD
jgi:ubiquitin-protein ligase